MSRSGGEERRQESMAERVGGGCGCGGGGDGGGNVMKCKWREWLE